VRGPSQKIYVAEVKAAIAKMKNNKAAGLSEVALEMLKELEEAVQSGCAMQLLKLVRCRKIEVRIGQPVCVLCNVARTEAF